MATHFEEGSKEYKKLVKYLAEDSELFAKARDNVVGADAGYGLDAEALVRVQDKIENGEQLTADEALAYGTYQTEVAAHMSEELLGSEAFIEKLVKRDGSLADKVVSRMQSLKETLSTVGDAEARAELAKIRKAEKLYLKAAEKAGNKELAKRLRGYIDEEKKAKSQTSGDFDGEQTSNTDRTDGQKENAPESESTVQYERKSKEDVNEIVYKSNKNVRAAMDENAAQVKKLQKKDPLKLKEKDLVDTLYNVKAKKLKDGTYIPVRINTPTILIEFAKAMGYALDNLPMAMRVYKASYVKH